MNTLISLIFAFGYIGLFFLIFAESGLLFGFFLPGDSVLFTAGLFAAHGALSIWILVPLVVAAAILGDSVGYWFGALVGPKLFERKDSRFFKKKYLHETERYFATYGSLTLIIARFTPAVRTFTPILAGVAHMKYTTFLRYNIMGGVLWGAGLTLLGYFLGSVIPSIDTYLYPIIALIIIVSLLPGVFAWWREK